jgi:hypothetical protein
VRPPTVDSHAKGLERHAKEAIARRLHRTVEGVSVREEDTAIVVSGVAPSFYAAQLALAAVRRVMTERADRRIVRSAITVPS